MQLRDVREQRTKGGDTQGFTNTDGQSAVDRSRTDRQHDEQPGKSCADHACADAATDAVASDAGLWQGEEVMAMRTLTELDAEQEALRERARQFELLTNQKNDFGRGIRVLEPRIAADAAAIEKLSTIVKIAADLPGDLPTNGSGFVAGGLLAHAVIQGVAADALAVVTRRHAEKVATLETCRRRLKEVEEALKAFDE